MACALLATSSTIGYAAPNLTEPPEAAKTDAPESGKAPVDQLIPWLLDEDRQLRGLPFTQVILDTTGKKVLAYNPNDEVDRNVGHAIGEVLDKTMNRMNANTNPIHSIPRINEVSSHFEDMLRDLLNHTPGLSCDFPRTAAAKIQRSGYPDLRIVHLASKRVFYLDPKLYVTGSRESSFRSFYFEPKVATNKVRDDAVHFVVGFEHEPRHDNRWKFTRWDLIDLSRFKVQLKAEFQGSNRDLYRAEAIVGSSTKSE